MRKHINFNINQLRRDTRKLLITDDDDKERIAIEKLAKDISTSQITTRADNKELWAKVERILHTANRKFPTGDTNKLRRKRDNATGNRTGKGTDCHEDKITRKTKENNRETG